MKKTNASSEEDWKILNLLYQIFIMETINKLNKSKQLNTYRSFHR